MTQNKEFHTLRTVSNSGYRPSRGKGPENIPILKDTFGLPLRRASMDEILDWIDHGATLKEIAGTLRCSHDKVEYLLKEQTGLTYGQIRDQACGRALIMLRKNQFKLAKTSAPMAIWLGQQYLGQTSSSSLQVSVEPEARKLLQAWEESLVVVDPREDIPDQGGRSPQDEDGEG